MPRVFNDTTKQILLSVATAGIVVVAATSPYFVLNLMRVLWKNPKLIKQVLERRKVSHALSRLKRSRLLIIQEKSNGTFIVQLTQRGKRKVQEIRVEALRIEHPKTWDGIWRIVMFDIPNTKTKARNALRFKLKDLGFYQLQKSVWVFPYPCNTEIEFLVELFYLYPYVHIIEAKNIQRDIPLKRYFKLL